MLERGVGWWDENGFGVSLTWANVQLCTYYELRKYQLTCLEHGIVFGKIIKRRKEIC